MVLFEMTIVATMPGILCLSIDSEIVNEVLHLTVIVNQAVSENTKVPSSPQVPVRTEIPNDQDSMLRGPNPKFQEEAYSVEAQDTKTVNLNKDKLRLEVVNQATVVRALIVKMTKMK